MRLQDKVAVVTGAASGIGAATALLFAREGATVIVADLLAAEGEQVVGRIKEAGGGARFQHLDVTRETDWERVVAANRAAHGRIDVLVNNAGISSSDPDFFSTAVWDNVMAVNAKGCYLGMKYVIPEMQKVKRGAVVNISSVAGFTGQKMVHMAYNASKAAVRLMTKSAAVQFAQYGIRVNSVHPGILPPMRTSRLTADPAIRAKLLNGVPMGREGRVEEVAYANLFLASDEASYITGTELVVDGGYLAM